MPGLPDGVGMYYDVEPQHDERYFRVMINEASVHLFKRQVPAETRAGGQEELIPF